jgi:hypothetical protein
VSTVAATTATAVAASATRRWIEAWILTCASLEGWDTSG